MFVLNILSVLFVCYHKFMKKDRLNTILDLVKSGDVISVDYLSNLLNVTPKTIRLDLTKLEDAGVIRRTYGGVMSVQPKNDTLYPTDRYKRRMASEKKEIAKRALGLIKPYSTICLDDGSTTLELARMLGEFPLNVITHDINIATELGNKPNIHIVVMGGIVTKSEIGGLIVHGDDTVKMIKKFNADIAFLGTACVDYKAGYTIYQLGHKDVKRAYISISSKAICLADSYKFGQVGFTKFAGPTEIRTIITDSSIKKEMYALYTKKGFEIIYK